MTGVQFIYGDHNYMADPIPDSQSTVAPFLQLGALSLTATRQCGRLEYATDREGLQRAEGVCCDVLSSLHSMISALGALMSQAHHQDVGAEQLREAGWLLVWLTEAAQFVEREGRAMREAIRSTSEKSRITA